MPKKRKSPQDHDESKYQPTILLPSIQVLQLNQLPDNPSDDSHFIDIDIFQDIFQKIYSEEFIAQPFNKTRKICEAKNDFENQTVQLKLMLTSFKEHDIEQIKIYLENVKDSNHQILLDKFIQYQEKQLQNQPTKQIQLDQMSLEKYKKNIEVQLIELVQQTESPTFYTYYQRNPITKLTTITRVGMNHNFITLCGLDIQTAHTFFYTKGLYYWFQKEEVIKYLIALFSFQLGIDPPEFCKIFQFQSMDNIKLDCGIEFKKIQGELLGNGYQEFAIVQRYKLDISALQRMEFVRSLMKKEQ